MVTVKGGTINQRYIPYKYSRRQSYGQKGERTYDGSIRSFVMPKLWTVTPKSIAKVNNTDEKPAESQQ